MCSSYIDSRACICDDYASISYVLTFAVIVKYTLVFVSEITVIYRAIHFMGGYGGITTAIFRICMYFTIIFQCLWGYPYLTVVWHCKTPLVFCN